MTNDNNFWMLVLALGLIILVAPVMRLFNPPINSYPNFFLITGIGILLIVIAIVKTSEIRTNKMTIRKGWDFEDDLDELFFPNTKSRAFLNLITLPIRWFIVCWMVIPLSYLIAVGMGFYEVFSGNKSTRKENK